MFRGLLKNPAFILGASLFMLTLLIALFAPLFMNVDTQTRVGLAYTPPSSEHWLGTDHMGIDMVSMLVAGLRSSLHVGFLAGTVATIVGTLIGVYSCRLGRRCGSPRLREDASLAGLKGPRWRHRPRCARAGRIRRRPGRGERLRGGHAPASSAGLWRSGT